MESKYLKRFQEAPIKPRLVGDRMIVEVLPKKELKTKGGIIVAEYSDQRTSTQENRMMLSVVLATGEYSYNDEGERIPFIYKPGQVIQTSRYGGLFLSEYPGLGTTGETLMITRSGEVHQVWDSFEELEKFEQGLSNEQR
jgi:co-chaperonin GroES (HSP10)